MLTGNLLRVKVGRSNLRPMLVSVNGPKQKKRAQQLLDMFERAITESMTRREIEEWIQSLSALDTDHKIFKGLGKVLFDRSQFLEPSLDMADPPSALEIRNELFALAANKGPYSQDGLVASSLSISQIYAQVAQTYGCTVPQIQRYMYSDLREMQCIESCKGFANPVDLLHRYNVALCQAILLRAVELRVKLYQVSPKWLRYLFRVIKFHKLMFMLEKQADHIFLKLDGPQSLFKQSTRYGMQLALFLPALLLIPTPWSMEGEIKWNNRKKKIALDNTLNLKSHYSERGVWRSEAEITFEERFRRKDRGWTLKTGDLIPLRGQRLLIPDFSFFKGDQCVHMEIVGFWRKGQLQNLLKHAPDNLILAVSRRLAGDKTQIPESIASRVVFFAEVIPLQPILDAISRAASNSH